MAYIPPVPSRVVPQPQSGKWHPAVKVNMMFKGFVSWLVERLANAVVWAVDFLLRLWKPKLEIRKEK